MLTLIFCTTLHSQIILLHSDTLPENPEQHTWVYWPEKKLVWHYARGGEWQTKGEHVDSVRIHAGMVMLGRWHDGEWGVFNAQGDQLIALGKQLICGPDFIVNWKHSSTVDYYGAGGRKQLVLDQGMDCYKWFPDTIQGQWTMCLPDFVQARKTVTCQEIHGWGMLSKQGEWLIKPIYDERFFWQNKVANVSLYGRRFKINEKGEELP